MSRASVGTLESDRKMTGRLAGTHAASVCSRVNLAGRTADTTRIVPVATPGRLPFGHGDIIELAVNDLRRRYARDPDPARLLGQTFTLRELRVVHQAVAGKDLQRDTFRRSVEDGLVPTGRMSEGLRGRPAELFERRPSLRSREYLSSIPALAGYRARRRGRKGWAHYAATEPSHLRILGFSRRHGSSLRSAGRTAGVCLGRRPGPHTCCLGVME